MKRETWNIETFYQNFCREEFGSDGVISGFEPVYDENFNFAYDVLDAIAEAEPDRRAMVWCSEHGEERSFTYGEMKRYSDQTANLLREHGVRKGDKVLLVLGRHYQFWFCIMALHKLGAVAVHSSYLLTEKDYIYRFNAAGIRYAIATAMGEVAENIDRACRRYDGMKARFLCACGPQESGEREGWIDFNAELPRCSDRLERVDTKASDGMMMYFTSGTTGNPKMAYHDFTYPIGHIISARHWHAIEPDGLHLTMADTGWAKASWGKIYGQWFVGAANFVYDHVKFVPADLMRAIAKYKVTSFCAPATVYRFFIKEGMEGFDFSSIRHASTAGEALNAEVFEKFYEHTGIKIMEAFGQSETTALCANLNGMEPRPGSMGRVSPLYQIDLLDADGDVVAPGEVGELCIRIPEHGKQIGLFNGYYLDEERTAEVWHDGYYHTGDTAWQDEDGYMWYIGRTDDMIKASGYRIGPFEIESVLMEHPAVRECAVTGVEDPMRGTVVKATVALTSGYKPGELLAKELQDFVKQQTAPYKYPRVVEFLDELPKTFSGKIKRADIRRVDEAKARQQREEQAKQARHIAGAGA